MFLILTALVAMLSFFADITSAATTTGGFTSIPEAIRDVYSKEVLFNAQPRCRFVQFAKRKDDLLATPGKGITFTKYGNLTGRSTLEEKDPLTSEGMSTSEISIAVVEHGKAITVTELALVTSMHNVLGDASKLLGNHLSVDLDLEFRDVVLSTTNIKYGNQKAGAASLVLNDGLTTATIKDMVELLETNNAPKFVREDGEFYVCIAHPHQLRQLRDDAAWINANTYMGRAQLYKGEVGMYEGVVFISTTNMPIYTSAEATIKYGVSVTPSVYEAGMFGEDSYGWAVALEPEMRDDGVKDFGRKHSLAYYGIWGSGKIEPKNIVKVVTA